MAYEKGKKKYQEQKEKELKKKKKEEEDKKKLEKENEEKLKQTNGQNSRPEPTIKEISPEEAKRRIELEKKEIDNTNTNEIKEETTGTGISVSNDSKETTEEKSKGLKPVGNGSITEFYSWTQPVINEINIQVPIPSIKTKDLIVKYTSKNLTIQIKGQDRSLVDGEFCKTIVADSLMWTIEESNGKKYIEINLQKLDKMSWWDCLIKGEPVIDLSKVSPESSKISDLDSDLQQTGTIKLTLIKVNKMMYDQNQKAQGKPTSEEQKKWEMLEKFKKAHPEMDFSKAKIS
jgi:hypothetical protein